MSETICALQSTVSDNKWFVGVYLLSVKGIVRQLGKYTYSLSCRELDKRIDTALMSVR